MSAPRATAIADAGAHQRRRQFQARLVRGGEEDQLAILEDPGFGRFDEAAEVAEVTKHLRQRPTGARPPGDGPQCQRRRGAEQAEHLASRVTGAAHHTDLDTHAATIPAAA
ncbi:MAG: hypothetical protein M3R09_03975 [Actinomycetota bacterium]|nr:hypothetical protein [Actinomycetota bacterium]